MDATERRLADFVVGELIYGADVAPLTVDTRLLKDGLLDSLSLRLLVEFIEQEFDVFFDEDELLPQNFETLRSIASVINRLRANSDR
jgi:acyl carrier protein